MLSYNVNTGNIHTYKLTESSMKFPKSTIFSLSLSCFQRQYKKKKYISELKVDITGDVSACEKEVITRIRMVSPIYLLQEIGAELITSRWYFKEIIACDIPHT